MLSDSMKTITVIGCILVFYSVNFLLEKRQGIEFAVDSTEAGNAQNLPIYSAMIQDLISGNVGRTGESIYPGYPPLYQITGAILLSMIGHKWNEMVFLNNIPFLLILVLFVFLLGREMADAMTGRIAAVLIAIFPLTYATFNKFSFDFPIMGMVVLSLFALLKSDHFRSTKWSVLFGISCGVGMLIKEPFGAYLIGPAVFSAVRMLARGRSAGDRSHVNAGISFAIFVCIIAYHYLGDVRSAYTLVFQRLILEPGQHRWYDFADLRYFTVGLWENQLSPVFAILSVVGFVYFIRRYRWHDARWIIILSMLIPNAILFFMPHWKSIRYWAPQQPLLALICALYIGHMMRKRPWVRPLVMCIILFGFCQYYLLKYNMFSINDRSWYGAGYFNARDPELWIDLDVGKQGFSQLEGTARAVAGALSSLPQKESYVLLFGFEKEPASIGCSMSISRYLWFAYGIKINMMYGYQVVGEMRKDFFERSVIDAVVYEQYTDDVKLGKGIELSFPILRAQYLNDQGITEGEARMLDWPQYEKQWAEFWRRCRYRGVAFQDRDCTISMYVPEVRHE